jgi:hypothetical protein
VRLTRRQFLGCTAAAVPLGRLRFGRPSAAVETTSACVLLDLGPHCRLRESVSGYEAALGARLLRADAQSPPSCSVLIVPAAVEIPSAAVQTIATCVQAGGTVILESGAGFASEREFRAHRAVLRDSLDVHVEAPVPLWRPAEPGIPYVDFTWPFTTKIRDFSRVVPLASQPGEIIARVDGLPVALRRRSGRGTLVFLGSPLGPALWAGDAEAGRWLEAVGKSERRVAYTDLT